jgi:hypothetical protein
MSDQRAPPPRVELLVAAVVLGILGAAVWGSHVAQGGFYWADDWHNARLYLFPDGTGFFGSVNTHIVRFSPLLAVLLTLPYKAFGVHPGPHLALAIALAVATSLAFYWLLRTLGLEPLAAGAAAALALVFPWSDSSRLWATGSINDVALIFYFLGLTLALRGLDVRGGRGVALAAASVLLYALSVLTYAVTAAAVLVGLPFYAYRAGWRRGLSRWAFDLLGAGAAVGYVAANQPHNHEVATTHEAWLDHAERIARQAGELFLNAVVPSAAVPRVLAGGLVAAVVGAALVALLRLGPSDPARAALSRWLVIGACATAWLAVAYAPFVPGRPKYLPAAQGLQNRANLFAAFALALLVVALAMGAGTLVARGLRRSPAWAATFAVGLSAVVGAGYIRHDAADKRLWATAWREERQQLSLAKRLIPHPPAQASIYSFPIRNYVAPGIAVFAVPNDYRDALRVTYVDPRLTGHVMRRGTHWRCARTRMYPVDAAYGYYDGTDYGKGYFVSVRDQLAVRIRDPKACRRWSARFGNPPVGQAVARRFRLRRQGRG